MKEQLISLETAKLAKEKGYNTTHKDAYDESTNLILPRDPYGHYYALKGTYPAPTQTILQLWLREEANIMVSVISINAGGYYNNAMVKTYKPSIEVLNYVGKNIFTSELMYDMFHGLEPMSYKEALELGLQEALKLIK